MMQKWEYCRVSFGSVVQHVVYMKPDVLHYQEIPSEGSNSDAEGLSALYRFVAQLGEEGWEMVDAVRDAGGEAETVWMKRPLP